MQSRRGQKHCQILTTPHAMLLQHARVRVLSSSSGKGTPQICVLRRSIPEVRA
jgi:hypothetical protein